MKQKVDNQENNEISKIKLLEPVRLSINPKFQDWVLFKNGTYIIFENAEEIDNLKEEAIRLIETVGPINIGNFSVDFDVTSLSKTEGWIVSCHGYGIYTYVSPQEIKSKNVKQIGLFGRNKRDLDAKNPIVIHINRK